MYRRLFCCTLLVAASLCFAQDDKPVFASPAKTKFAPMAGIPPCATLSVLRGDPTKGAAIILLKAAAGCKIPWHWHTANESLVIVSGKAKIEMKDESAAQSVGAGDYVYLPAKHQHQFTAVTATTLYDMPDGAFDIHYVDASGKEIPPDEALKSGAKPAAKKAPAKKE